MIYIINIILGGIFVYCDIYHIDSNLIKWLISFNCFIYLVIKKVSPPAILASALAFIADYFLLFTNHYLIGISLFIMVQLTYMYLIKYANYFPFVFLGLILINPLVSLALIYLGFSLLNLYHSFKIYKKLFIAVFLSNIFPACRFWQVTFISHGFNNPLDSFVTHAINAFRMRSADSPTLAIVQAV